MQKNSFLEQLNEIISQNLHNENFGVSELAKELDLNRTILYRKIKSYTGKSASKYLSEIRLQKAQLLLHDQAKSVSEVAYEVGFASPSYFIKCFRNYYGYSPGDFQKENHVIVADNKTKQNGRKKNSIREVLAVIVLIILTATVFTFIFYNKPVIEKTIAVLPPKDISPEGNECIIIEGLRESLNSSLTNIA